MKTIALKSGELVPSMGLGTWHMGERTGNQQEEIKALSLGLDLGMCLIDTAEMYGRGGAERVVAEAIKGRRNEVFIVSKVLPHNASRRGTIEACNKSLQRMGIETIDLYLLHWPGRYPLNETVIAFQQLQHEGKIRHWGVSNFDVQEMEKLSAVPGGDQCEVNQVLYNLSRRGIEWDLLPWCEKRQISIMAYSPLEQGRLTPNPTLQKIAKQYDVSPFQVALAWTLRRDGIITIPKAGLLEHVQENRLAWDLSLSHNDLQKLDKAFAPPLGKKSLDIL